jgi:hypothetical protein
MYKGFFTRYESHDKNFYSCVKGKQKKPPEMCAQIPRCTCLKQFAAEMADDIGPKNSISYKVSPTVITNPPKEMEIKLGECLPKCILFKKDGGTKCRTGFALFRGLTLTAANYCEPLLLWKASTK